jgi:hypothetical protein
VLVLLSGGFLASFLQVSNIKNTKLTTAGFSLFLAQRREKPKVVSKLDRLALDKRARGKTGR